MIFARPFPHEPNAFPTKGLSDMQYLIHISVEKTGDNLSISDTLRQTGNLGTAGART